MGIAFAILAFGYLLNSVSDRRMDLDPRKNPFIDGGAREHRLSLTLLVAMSLLLALFSPLPAQIATVFCLAFGCIYSVGPRLKSVPIIGSLMNLANFGPLLFVGMRDAELPQGFAWLVLAFAALLLQNQLIHEAADNDEDRGGGVHTTWQMLGPTRTAAVIAMLGVTAMLAAATLASAHGAMIIIVLGAAVFVAGFPVLLLRTGQDSEKAARLRVTHRWYALVAGIVLFSAWRWT